MPPDRQRSRAVRSAIIAIAGAGALVLVLWVVTLFLPDPRPATIEAATATVTSHLDRIEDTIPEEVVQGRSERIAPLPCPLEESGPQVKVQRVIDVDPHLDRARWAADLSHELAKQEGWVMRVTTQGATDARDDLRIRIVSPDLTIVNVIASDAAGTARITMHATSECTQPG
ncbi:hypothetical protein LC082_06850 [Microbacterium esteraromaticum]|uniref:hypothetical protein n=1 Tax=Microbacterium esteraromaticum TaxID=57043 RepID=UPI001CD3E3C3|nr:hypothetical protein [Microbacterium esteraromaticum]MCA1306609.1 hypothetical protein [Microbacterium esteraromaticum]